MLLLHVIISCILFGSSTGVKHEKICYGNNFRFPFDYTPPLFNGPLYFTPSNGGSSRIIMDNGEAKDPRLKVSYASVTLTHLTERDDGVFSVSFDSRKRFDIINLKILDCAEKVTRSYGAMYSCNVPQQAEFLEFTPLHAVDQPKILWNRTNPQTNKGGRGQVRHTTWEIQDLTQADNGYYNFRNKDNTLLSRKLLTVQEYYRNYDPMVNERLLIRFPVADALWTVTFTRKGKTEPTTVMKAGRLSQEGSWAIRPFKERIWILEDAIEISHVESTDSGTFEFRDPQGNLALSVHVEVKHVSVPTSVYVAVAVGIIVVVTVCCCCVRKCCCKKSSSKTDENAVFNIDENRPAGPSYSAAPAPNYSYQPVNPLVSREPATTSLGPSVYNPVNIHVNPPQSEVAAPSLSAGFDCLSSGSEPKFELKGLSFPSAPPLSSDSTFSDVYTSDKLNFL